MSVGTEVSQVDYVGNDATQVFPVAFPFKDSSQLRVLWSFQEVVDQLLVEGIDYTVDGGAGLGGNVTFVWVPDGGGEIHIERTVPYEQPTSFSPNAPYLPVIHERALDNLEYQIQQLVRLIAALTARVAALESIGIPTEEFAGILLQLVPFTTDADAVENGFPLEVALPAGWTATGVALVKCVENGDPTIVLEDAPAVYGWSQTGTTLSINFISGLKPGTTYAVTLEITNVVS